MRKGECVTSVPPDWTGLEMWPGFFTALHSPFHHWWQSRVNIYSTVFAVKCKVQFKIDKCQAESSFCFLVLISPEYCMWFFWLYCTFSHLTLKNTFSEPLSCSTSTNVRLIKGHSMKTRSMSFQFSYTRVKLNHCLWESLIQLSSSEYIVYIL